MNRIYYYEGNILNILQIHISYKIHSRRIFFPDKYISNKKKIYNFVKRAREKVKKIIFKIVFGDTYLGRNNWSLQFDLRISGL